MFSGQSVATNPNIGIPRLRRPVVALLVYEQIGAFHLAGPLLVFSHSEIGIPQVDLRICAVTPGHVHARVGFEVNATGDLETLASADVVVLPGWHSANTPVPESLQRALHRAYARGAHIVGLCLGVFVLAAAGLLAERKVTTHWARTELLTRCYPEVQQEPNLLYTCDERIWTSAGGASGIDVCLEVLRRLCGVEIAAEVAQHIVSAPQREGVQAQLLERPIVQTHADRKIRALLDWVGQHLHENPGLPALANRAGMSVRALTRGFKQVTGTSYAQWLLHQRLQLAQRLLQGSDDTIEAVAAQVGFATGTSLRQHFRRRYGCTPGQFRALHREQTLPAPNGTPDSSHWNHVA